MVSLFSESFKSQTYYGLCYVLCAASQCKVYLSNVRTHLAYCLEEATAHVRKLEEGQEVYAKNRGEITTIKKRDLRRFIELGENSQKDTNKLLAGNSSA